jgi:hypothetical protein
MVPGVQLEWMDGTVQVHVKRRGEEEKYMYIHVPTCMYFTYGYSRNDDDEVLLRSWHR